MTLDPAKPIYQQIIDEVRRRLARGELRPGDQIPSQREMATLIRVNPNTVQRAYREMEQAGLVSTARGQGTYISVPLERVAEIRREMAREALMAFVREMAGLGIGREQAVHMVNEAFTAYERSSSPGPVGRQPLPRPDEESEPDGQR
ncbi:MAG TPA: GntR family transcriptional regulator [Limnochordia bacterium]